MIDGLVADAIKEINPDASFSIDRNDTDRITWLGGTSPILKADIENKINELRADYNAKQYQRDRELAYPPIGDQLDMQYWDKVNGTSTWQDAVQAVKDKYPKS